MEKYDIGIIGAGVAGAFAALKSAKNYKNAKVIDFTMLPTFYKNNIKIELAKYLS